MYLAIIVLFIIVLLVLAQWAERAFRKAKPYPYAKREALFTGAERRFLSVLEQSVGADYRIMGKVRLADIIAVDERLAGDKARAARGKINQKHVDFALCAPFSLAVVLVVELDDRSHERADRKARGSICGRRIGGGRRSHRAYSRSIALFHCRRSMAHRGSAQGVIRAANDENTCDFREPSGRRLPILRWYRPLLCWRRPT